VPPPLPGSLLVLDVTGSSSLAGRFTADRPPVSDAEASASDVPVPPTTTATDAPSRMRVSQRGLVCLICHLRVPGGAVAAQAQV
jgi:hypothetical protein